MLVHGILTVEDQDRQGQVIGVAGCDLTRLVSGRRCFVHHFGNLGPVRGARAILGPEELVTDTDRALWDVARGRPFVKVWGQIVEELRVGREFAAAINHPNRDFYFGLMGSALEIAGNRIDRCLVDNVLITDRGVHPAQRVFIGPG
jgi:hypothetical protein